MSIIEALAITQVFGGSKETLNNIQDQLMKDAKTTLTTYVSMLELETIRRVEREGKS